MRRQICLPQFSRRTWFTGLQNILKMNSHMFQTLGSLKFGFTASVANRGPSLRYIRLHSVCFAHSEAAPASNSDNLDKQTSSVEKVTSNLAQSLASLLDEPSKPASTSLSMRMYLKRLMEIRIKKRVKEQYIMGKYHNLLSEVVANPETLRNAYDSLRLNSNIDLALPPDDICFEDLAEQLGNGKFIVKENVLHLSTRTRKKEVLILPNLKLQIIQEAIRIALEVVYRPLFSKISHGCRSGRGHTSAARYICDKVPNSTFWFAIRINQVVDTYILANLISVMQKNIEDSSLFSFLHEMLNAEVLNFEFGGFPKGQGLPQEGVLSPILMNIYLDLFDKELYKLCMRYEGLGPNTDNSDGVSRLRSWFRRQMKDGDAVNLSIRIWACRYMDEIVIAVSGSKNLAYTLKADIQNCLKNDLYLNVDEQTEVQAVSGSSGIQFLGMVFQSVKEDGTGIRTVHKLKDKVHLFASQSQKLWDAGTLRIGKKWLAYGLKKTKESEIKHLADETSLLNRISHFRKDGMKTDHWFKFLLREWMHGVNARLASNEEELLSKYIVEPALPQDLRDSFYNFQKCARRYISSESDSTLSLLSSYQSTASSNPESEGTRMGIFMPIHYIKKNLGRYGLVNSKGFPKRVSYLILQDNSQIIHWFLGLTSRWLKWFAECHNFTDIKVFIVNFLRMSCIRTIASKHQIDETLAERKFGEELSQIPSTEEIEPDIQSIESDRQLLNQDEALIYGIYNSGLCVLSLTGLRDPSRPCECSVLGCRALALGIYAIHVNEKQRFPGWKTGFSSAIHPSMNRRRICLCKKHVEDLYMGHISLQSISFETLRR